MTPTIDTTRPAVALVIVPTRRRRVPAVQPGYWQPDGSWADADGGGLRDTITALIESEGTVSVVCQSFTGETTNVIHYGWRNLPKNGGSIELPTVAAVDPQPGFKLSIDLGNAAMCRVHHVSDALRDVADVIDGGTGRIRDNNGNTVGSWSLVLPDPADLDEEH